MDPLAHARGQDALGSHHAGGEFLDVIDGEVLPKLEGNGACTENRRFGTFSIHGAG